MSLVDDQIRNDSDNALDKLSREINNAKDPLKAVAKIQQFEEDLNKAKTKKPTKDKNTIVVPDNLLREIREDMER